MINCKKCLKDKNESQYYIKDSTCKMCRRSARRDRYERDTENLERLDHIKILAEEWRENNVDKVREAVYTWHSENKLKISKHKSKYYKKNAVIYSMYYRLKKLETESEV